MLMCGANCSENLHLICICLRGRGRERETETLEHNRARLTSFTLEVCRWEGQLVISTRHSVGQAGPRSSRKQENISNLLQSLTKYPQPERNFDQTYDCKSLVVFSGTFAEMNPLWLMSSYDQMNVGIDINYSSVQQSAQTQQEDQI